MMQQLFFFQTIACFTFASYIVLLVRTLRDGKKKQAAAITHYIGHVSFEKASCASQQGGGLKQCQASGFFPRIVAKYKALIGIQ